MTRRAGIAWCVAAVTVMLPMVAYAQDASDVGALRSEGWSSIPDRSPPTSCRRLATCEDSPAIHGSNCESSHVPGSSPTPLTALKVTPLSAVSLLPRAAVAYPGPR